MTIKNVKYYPEHAPNNLDKTIERTVMFWGETTNDIHNETPFVDIMVIITHVIIRAYPEEEILKTSKLTFWRWISVSGKEVLHISVQEHGLNLFSRAKKGKYE